MKPKDNASYCLLTPCHKCKPKERHFFDNFFSLKRDSAAWKCLFCHIAFVRGWENMIHHMPSIICDFHLPVDFRLDILFPHIFRFLHQNWVETRGFTLASLRKFGEADKTIPSCKDSSSPKIAPPDLLQSAFCALKQNRLAVVRSFQVFGFSHFKWCYES